MTKTCLWIDATRAGDFELFQFDCIVRAAPGTTDVYLVTNLDPSPKRSAHININNDEIFSKENNLKQAVDLIPGNPDLKMLAFVNLVKSAGYSSYIRMEFDCVFSHDLKQTLSNLVEVAGNYDVGFTNRFPLDQYSAEWPWWQSLTNMQNPNAVLPGGMYGAFLPVMTFSDRFIQAYKEFLSNGWTGHYEVLVPSFAAWAGLNHVDFGSNPEFNIDSKVFTVHRPNAFDSETSNFFHPVKSFPDFAKLPTRTLANYAMHDSQALDRHLRFYRNEALSGLEFDYVKQKLHMSHRLLSFGCAGVAEVACASDLQEVLFASSDRQITLAFAQYPALRDPHALGNLKTLFINIGKTGSWGIPAFPEEPGKWIRYLDLEWVKWRYDTILVGGRFRVALSAAIYMNYYGRMQPLVLVKDFRQREHYSDILQLYEVVDECDSITAFRFRTGKLEDAQKIADRYMSDHR